MPSLKLTFYLILLLFCSLYPQFSLNYGVRAGLAVSNQDWKYTDYSSLSTKNLQSVTIRFYADYSIIPLLAFQAEIGYTGRGFTNRIEETTVTMPDGTGKFYELNNKLSYIHAALPVRVTLPVNLLSVFLLAGPQYFVMLSNDTDTPLRTVSDKFKKSSAGYTAGVGIEFGRLLPFTLTAEYRYEADLDKIYETNLLSVKNYTQSVMVGIRF